MFENCLLVKMKRSRPGQVVLDNQATRAYNEEKDTDAAIYKHLFKNSKHVNTLNNIYQSMYLYHINHSLPWMDEGFRIISGEHCLGYMECINNFQEQLNVTLRDMGYVYPEMVKEDLARLKGMGNENDYPTYDKFKEAWKVDVKFRPVPQSADYRVAIPQEIKDTLEGDLSRLSQESLSLVKQNIVAAFNHAHEQLQKADGERRIFQSMLDNINNLLARVPKLNVCNDVALDEWVAKMTTVIAPFDIKELRTYQAARSAFILETSSLLESL